MPFPFKRCVPPAHCSPSFPPPHPSLPSLPSPAPSPCSDRQEAHGGATTVGVGQAGRAGQGAGHHQARGMQCVHTLSPTPPVFHSLTLPLAHSARLALPAPCLPFTRPLSCWHVSCCACDAPWRGGVAARRSDGIMQTQPSLLRNILPAGCSFSDWTLRPSNFFHQVCPSDPPPPHLPPIPPYCGLLFGLAYGTMCLTLGGAL